MVAIPFFSKKKKTDSLPVDWHMAEKEQFRAVLQSFNATRINDRLTVLDVFLSSERHMTLSELGELLREKHPEFYDLSFLTDTMAMFCQFGFAQEITFESQETRYEHSHLGTHHDHFICTRCGTIEEFINPALEELQVAIARQYNFHPLQHKMEIYGLCENCMALRDSTIPLALAANGEKVVIVQILGDAKTRKRLLELGLIPGQCIEVINNHAAGKFILALLDSRLAITSDMAEKILVEHRCVFQESEE